jgi:mRNA interferase MazF
VHPDAETLLEVLGKKPVRFDGHGWDDAMPADCDANRPQPGARPPHVVVQNNLLNRSNIGTVPGCPLNTNLKRANSPGNVLLDAKESGLPGKSVVNLSQVFKVDKAQLEVYVVTLVAKRVEESPAWAPLKQ